MTKAPTIWTPFCSEQLQLFTVHREIDVIPKHLQKNVELLMGAAGRAVFTEDESSLEPYVVPGSNNWRDEHEMSVLCSAVVPLLNASHYEPHRSACFHFDAIAADLESYGGNSPCSLAYDLLDWWMESKYVDNYLNGQPLSPYLNSTDFKGDHDAIKFDVTIGNIAAALALVKLDRSIVASVGQEIESALIHMSWSAIFFERSTALTHELMIYHFEHGGRRARARKIAEHRHATSKIATTKAEVKQWWKMWRDGEIAYKGKAAFARAMLDKYPDDLTSIPVIERWISNWDKGLA